MAGQGRPGGAAAGYGGVHGNTRPAGGAPVGGRPGAAGTGGRNDAQQLAQQLQNKVNISSSNVAGSAASDDGDDKLSASQRKRMRKKLREKALAGK